MSRRFDVPDGYLPLSPRARQLTPPRRADTELDAADLTAPGSPASLRQKTRRLGVSRETVRQAMRAAGASTDLETRHAGVPVLGRLVAGSYPPATKST